MRVSTIVLRPDGRLVHARTVIGVLVGTLNQCNQSDRYQGFASVYYYDEIYICI